MQAQVKYKSEVKTAVLGDRTITVKISPPSFPRRNRTNTTARSSAACLKCSANMPGVGRPESSLLYGGIRGII